MEKNYKMRYFLKCFFMFLCAVLIALAVAIFSGTFLLKTHLILYKEYLEGYYSKPILFLLVGSIMMFAAGFLGIISAVQNWPQGILTFRVCIIYLFLAMFALGAIITFVLSKSADEAMYSAIRQHMRNYSSNEEIIDKLQINFACCGVDDFEDWTNQFHTDIPGSCCDFESTCDFTRSNKKIPPGCFKVLKEFINHYTRILVIILSVLGITEIFAIFTSCLFGRAVEKRIEEKMLQYRNDLNDSIQIPRIHNPLGRVVIIRPQKKLNSQPIYVRRPSERPVSLTYRNPHEVYLHKEPKYRFDLRVPRDAPKSKNLHSYDERFQ